MFLLHIRPVTPERADEKVLGVYHEMTELLHLKTVPLVFQYIAIYEPYFFYLWDRIKYNLLSDSFHESCAELKEMLSQTVTILPTPSKPLQHLVKDLHANERYGITEVVNVLDDTNIRLMLLTIGIRESLKGIPHIATLLPDKQQPTQDNLDEILQIRQMRTHEEQKKEVVEATRMLAPLLGDDSIMISHYTDFFGSVAMEMKELKNMPAYLYLRVELEHQAFARIKEFPRPLDCSYIDFMRMTDGIPYTDEILFLLKDTFPSQFPHLVLTTAVMKQALAAKGSSLAL
jgi:hypothetical protein